jgi:hypothetical protein
MQRLFKNIILAGNMAQVVDYLPIRHKALSSNFLPPKKNFNISEKNFSIILQHDFSNLTTLTG